jgi:hypothetical protein
MHALSKPDILRQQKLKKFIKMIRRKMSPGNQIAYESGIHNVPQNSLPHPATRLNFSFG